LAQQMMAQALREGSCEVTVQRLRKDGSEFTARVVLTPRLAGDGTLSGFLLMSMDITDEVRVTTELERTQAYARSLLESAPDAMVIVDEAGRIQLTNAATETLFGYTRDELIDRPVETLIPERYHDRHPVHRASFFSEPRVRPMGAGLELSGRRKDGGEFPVEISLSPLETDEGRLAIAAIRDVTERRSADQKFESLLETAPDAMLIVDQEGTMVLVNVQTEKLFGYRRDALIGHPVETLMPDRYRGRHPWHRTSFFSAPRVRPMGAGLELWGQRADGSEFPIEISLSPLETEEGLLATAAIRDVTEPKRVAGELRRANTDLEAASVAKDRFLASMSHELRTPLNAVLGFTGTLLMGLPGPLTDEQKKQLTTVQLNGRHLLSLINDLLDLAKIESGKVEVNLEPVACRALLSEVALGLRPLAEGKGIELELASPDQEVEVRSDRRALSQILINLTNNAIKFTDQGRVRLAVTRQGNGEAGVSGFSVADTGRGIKNEDQERLFAAFEQTSGYRPQEGTGLGLYISQKLAGLIGGTISFESELGRGSTFTLELRDREPT
jgi:PAS domain S-box-containing protein